MLRYNFLNIILLLIVPLLSLQAQNKKFAVKTSEALKVYMNPLLPGAEYNITHLKQNAEGLFEAALPASPNGFYNIVVVKDNAQYFTPVYYPGEGDVTIDVDISQGVVGVNDSYDNAVLGKYTRISSAIGRALWHTPATDDAKLYEHITKFIVAADSLLAVENCAPAVEEYIRLWAYTSAYNGINSAEGNAKHVKHELQFTADDVMGDCYGLFDSSMASLFQETDRIVAGTLPSGTNIMAKFDSLYSKYKNKEVRASLANYILATFVARHNYAKDFDGGLAQLKEVVEKYELDTSFVKDYEKRRATITGADFPTDVVLCDANGEIVDFSIFKGKYVYIDIWASWCVPCLKEIPHLLQLEKELQNPNVVFLSLSMDKKTATWKKKMADLGLHGHQLIDVENRLLEALNLKGIPFFVIYDKEGRLYMMNAPRPSDAKLKEILEGLK